MGLAIEIEKHCTLIADIAPLEGSFGEKLYVSNDWTQWYLIADYGKYLKVSFEVVRRWLRDRYKQNIIDDIDRAIDRYQKDSKWGR